MILRRGKLSDAEDIADIYSYYVENTPITFEMISPSADEMRERLKTAFPFYVIEEDGKVVAFAYTHPFHERGAYERSREVTVYVRKGFFSRGYGGTLYEAMENDMKGTVYHNLYAVIAYPGTGSVEFHEKMGYRIVAHLNKCGEKLGKLHDVVYMEKLL